MRRNSLSQRRRRSLADYFLDTSDILKALRVITKHTDPQHATWSRLQYSAVLSSCPTPPSPPKMQSMPESRQQTFEEIYGPPENFLEIEVRNLSRTANPHISQILTPQPGQKPPNPRLLPTQHVHLLRNPHTHQHPRLQTPPLRRPPPLLRFRILPRRFRTRVSARDYTTVARQGIYESVQ